MTSGLFRLFGNAVGGALGILALFALPYVSLPIQIIIVFLGILACMVICLSLIHISPAAEFDNQIDEETKKRRQEQIMQLQQEISDEMNEALIGQTREVLVEGYDVYIRMWYGRSAGEAPEVDGKIFFSSDKEIEPGEFINVKLLETSDGELVGEAL